MPPIPYLCGGGLLCVAGGGLLLCVAGGGHAAIDGGLLHDASGHV